ncbi:MAG: SDR family oxidoreductase [Rhodospirillaceae bacterium]|jgi:3-oxoacyl-[acyl-carrier protein] reductase|nr:SDR family oxidoreductase [Rhodospirillaceae bacterium]MBT5241266.1 SDR family oxidoreductase [Rhodospirillaceae bacterium]MBT5565099.1 SDR family oxidoreductase [Rhodospirillaceae bacterium]MBT6088121.1 SDR family oxidoreductase [Rhodospirillaceae bacterium]MBT6961508.1 SDR family oxidoreductase [Rhodospirillaceae bacterium]
MTQLKDKTALITGANRGIGAGVARAFAAEGAAVAINYPNAASADEANALCAEIEAAGAKAIAVEGDVTEEKVVEAMVAQAIAGLGRIDILVNNAGIAHAAPVEDIPVDMWDKVFAVHVRGTFLTCKHTLRHMYERSSGRIINTTSQLAYLGAAGFAHYTAAKGALVTFTRTLALEAASKGVGVNAVAPGATRTAMLEDVPEDILEGIRQSIPLGKLAEIDDIVPSYVFLASDGAKHYVGQVISPNGGDMFL